MTPVSTEPQTAAQAEITPAPPVTAPSTAGMTTKVVKGSLWTLAGQVAPLAVSLITTPFVIRMLGAESYGVLILVGLIPTYLGFADFGMGVTSTKFASEAYAQGDPAREARIVRTAALIALCSSLPVAFALFAFSSQIISLFRIPENLHGEASLALKIAAVTFVLNFLNGIFNTPQLTRLRMDLNTMVNAGFRILGLILTPFAVYIGGVVAAVSVLLVASLLTLLGHIAISTRLDKHLLEFTFDRPNVRPMAKFGGAIVLAGFASLILLNGEKGLVSALVSVESLAYYSVAFTFASMLTLLSASMSQSLVPAFSQLISSNKRVELAALFSRAVILIILLFLPVGALLIILSRLFFQLWAGEDFAVHSTVPFYILMAGVSFYLPSYVPNSVLISSGKANILAKIYLVELIPFLILAFVLTKEYGIIGTAAAWAIRVVIDSAMLFYFARRTSGAELRPFRGNGISIMLASVLLAPGILIGITVSNSLPLSLVAFVFGLLGYCVAVWKIILEMPERDWMRAAIRGRVIKTLIGLS